MGLVFSLVSRYLSRGAEREDLVQVASLGLVRALRGFDASRGFSFSTYAVPVIDGAIRDYLRTSSTLHVPRSARQIAARLSASRSVLGEGATLAEVAEHAGVSAEEAALASEALAVPASLSELCEAGLEPAFTDAGFEAVLDRTALQEGMRHLEKREQALIDLRYFHGLTQNQTARVLCMTQVQVSRAEKRILQKLRDLLS
ncbi:MAG: sigma-70 family RNA polymerase sigma factor [Clostridia bacterium]|nr:sigma-70 family RNA polymerase sigma factor [Clostridia bacterium]